MALLLLDLMTALSMVDRDLLTHHVTNIGVHGVVLKWLYLIGQQLKVALEKIMLTEDYVNRRFPLSHVGLKSICAPPPPVWCRVFGLGCYQYADESS